jgi:hypothetical protein
MRQFVIIMSNTSYTKLQDIDTYVIFTVPTYVAKQYPANIAGIN